MSKILHKGIRPTYPTEPVVATKKRKLLDYQVETMPDGSKRYWNKRMLTSGCGEVVTDGNVRGDLIYCKTCDEWFDVTQFEKV
jgi:hypothetical protein